jgi:hypothetical protein
VLGGLLHDDTIKFLLIANDRLADEVGFLRTELQAERQVSKRLLDKVLGTDRIKVDFKQEDMQPIGGYVRMADKIAEAERKSKEELRKLQDADQI